jgi:MarR-like DNA-binding transcriptional regulator SgrR of sgrS sRNA
MSSINSIKKLAVLVISLCFIFSIKVYYGGEVRIRLNEPNSFTHTSSNYSHTIFFSLLYENFFYLMKNGEIKSHIFKTFNYEKPQKTLHLNLKEHLSFSDGKPITPNNIKESLKNFLGRNLESSKKMGRVIKDIRVDGYKISIEMLYDTPDVLSLFSTPELILMSGKDQSFSGSFYPDKWVQGEYIRLLPNKYYPGGRTYLDSFKVEFVNQHYPDIFISNPGAFESKFKEYNSGIYQNIYISFPEGKVGENTRIALYSLLREFFKTRESVKEYQELNTLTSNEESPITLNIKELSNRRVHSLLKYSKIKLYVLSSLKKIGEELEQFLEKKRLSIEITYLNDSQLIDFMNSTSLSYLLIEKTFSAQMPLDEKIKKIVKEMSFSRYNEGYLKLLNELNEVKFLKDEELLIDQLSRIIEKLINDGSILPLYQKKYSLYVNPKVKGLKFDYYGRPLFQDVRF